MSLSLDQLKAAFKKNENEGGTNRPNNYYPFWNLQEGQQAIVRFLPDKNTNNPLGFLVEKLMHTLDINGEKKSAPCLRMYNEDCPICKVSSAYYKAEDKANGKKYWRKKQHIAQGLVVEDPLPADENTKETHEGKVRFFALGYQLFNVIKEAFEGGELEDVPYSQDGGYDFIIKKTKQGDYAGYAVGSRFRAKARELTKTERSAADDQMIDLATLLPQNPGEEKLSAMLTAALNGTAYEEKQSDKPTGFSFNKKGSKPVSVVHTDEDDNIPEEVATPAPKATPKVEAEGGQEFDAEAKQILESIRSRMKKKAE
ncbi:MAG: hypothetical protein KGI25_08935 [Thaumarchaeota archaeon]|nr:hypothetical protein [Nitrososphaerota archaeon]